MQDKGYGVIATEVIEVGEAILEFTGPILKWDDIEYGSYDDHHSLMIGPDQYQGSSSGGPDDIVNHSCDPNAEIIFSAKIFIQAIKQIAVGEEITYDYEVAEKGRTSDYRMNCKCGAKNCRGTVGKKI